MTSQHIHAPRLLHRLAIGTTALVMFAFASIALGQSSVDPTLDEPIESKHSLLDFVVAGGIIGYLIIALSIAAVALIIDLVMKTKREKLIPDNLVRHSLELADHGRVNELLAMTRASDTLFGRIVSGALERGKLGIEAVRQEMQQLGEAELLRLRQRIGYIGIVATAGPMLGLLGTVIGMINSFSVLGESKNAARPDELAVGISTALVTTCQGLILAVPLIFVHGWLRDRVTKIGQQLAHAGDRLLGTLAVTATRRPGVAPAQGVPQVQQSRVSVSPPPAASSPMTSPSSAMSSNAFGHAPPNADQSSAPSFGDFSKQPDFGGLARG